jgi:CheY-like chemotaxis protein
VRRTWLLHGISRHDSVLAERLQGAPLTVRVLLVTPHPEVQAHAREHLGGQADVDVCIDFATARTRLVEEPYDLLVTALRLGEFNGLHLVHVARALRLPTAAVVFDTNFDQYLASMVQSAGAFYEHSHRVAAAAPTYLTAALPPRDRRDARVFERRSPPRGGRRRADLASAQVRV